MAKKRLLWRLFLSYLFITVLAMLATLVFASWAVREFYYRQIEESLEIRARLMEPEVIALMDRAPELDSLLKRLGKESHTRFTVILPDGRVLADSEESPLKMDNHADRPEVRAAFHGEVRSSNRYSQTLQKNMLYLAVPLMAGDETKGVLRSSMPIESVGMALRRVHVLILIGGFIIAGMAVLTGLFMSRQISRPLENMRHVAEKFSAGELDSRLPVPDVYELAGLAEALNEMAAQLDQRIQSITWQRNYREAILASMLEGVIAVDRQEKITSINQAACRMLGVSIDKARERILHEAVRNADLQRAVSRSLSEQDQVEAEIELENGERRSLQIDCSVLRGPDDESIGAVIVLNDITRLRRLENLRREFVGNVSHELRTPITSIKGFVETLQDGALKVPEDAERFLAIISRQADQLNVLVDDLLLLSRVETEEEKGAIELESREIAGVLEAVVEAVSVRAGQKDISIGLNVEPGLIAKINEALLTQAVINLINNAVNCSRPGSEVMLQAKRTEIDVEISVKDQGCGIESRHLPRIFERFYRVDKARSRETGGTGLGLAIVKHIVNAHNGSVTVESEPGVGSAFTIHLPIS